PRSGQTAAVSNQPVSCMLYFYATRTHHRRCRLGAGSTALLSLALSFPFVPLVAVLLRWPAGKSISSATNHGIAAGGRRYRILHKIPHPGDNILGFKNIITGC
ncbi:unnamed protein product, partial [Ectocarpus sp. 12 AP-2014]